MLQVMDYDDSLWGFGKNIPKPWKKFWDFDDEDEGDGEAMLALTNFTLKMQPLNAEDQVDTSATTDFLHMYTEPDHEGEMVLLDSKEALRVVYVCTGVGNAVIQMKTVGRHARLVALSVRSSGDRRWCRIVLPMGKGV